MKHPLLSFKVWLYLSAILCCVFASTVKAKAELERILLFDSDVIINKDASLDVTERIVIEVNGDTVKRGIFRDFPTIYKGSNGETVNIGFTVLSVKREGQDEPYAVETIDNGKRIRIGRKEVLLPLRPTVYEIRYRTTRQLGFFADFDELFWNVTGNAWIFPIEKARIDIHLPEGAVIQKTTAYTGPQGARGRNYQVEQQNGSYFAARTTLPLASYEGFSVVIAWPKGFVDQPSTSDQLWRELSDNSGAVLILLGVVVVGLYYWLVWQRVGRDPLPGPIVPLFRPPADLQAADMRYVRKERFDDKTFTCSLIELATKKALVIKQEDSDYTLVPTDTPVPTLSKLDAKILRAIGSRPLAIDTDNHAKIASARGILEEVLEARFRGVAFHHHRGWFVGGVFLSLLFFALALFSEGPQSMPGTALTFLFVGFGVFAATAGWRVLWTALGGSGSLFLIRLLPLFAVIPLMAGSGILSAWSYITGNLSIPVLVTIVAAVVIGLLNMSFFHLLSAPTKVGRGLKDQIEGFRLFLAATEEDRLNLLNPPQRTPDLFERYLPYAFALDCEQDWSEAFSEVLAKAGIAAPDWYEGTQWTPTSFGRAASNFGHSLSSSTAAAAVAPGSSSGFSSSSSSSSGGSGGGGGGGGGGGW